MCVFDFWCITITYSTSGSCGNGNRNLGVRYINLRFPNETNYYNMLPDRASGGAGGFNPKGHINSQGYVRHSGFGVDSANTEATLISRGGEFVRNLIFLTEFNISNEIQTRVNVLSVRGIKVSIVDQFVTSQHPILFVGRFKWPVVWIILRHGRSFTEI